MYYSGIPKSPAVNITDYYFGMTNVTVTLEWTQESDVTYNVSIHPKVELEYTRENVLLVMIPYNISYHINVVASLCGQYSTTTTLVLNYGRPTSMVASIIIILCSIIVSENMTSCVCISDYHFGKQ